MVCDRSGRTDRPHRPFRLKRKSRSQPRNATDSNRLTEQRAECKALQFRQLRNGRRGQLPRPCVNVPVRNLESRLTPGGTDAFRFRCKRNARRIVRLSTMALLATSHARRRRAQRRGGRVRSGLQRDRRAASGSSRSRARARTSRPRRRARAAASARGPPSRSSCARSSSVRVTVTRWRGASLTPSARRPARGRRSTVRRCRRARPRSCDPRARRS